jgi:hypothetical protein
MRVQEEGDAGETRVKGASWPFAPRAGGLTCAYNAQVQVAWARTLLLSVIILLPLFLFFVLLTVEVSVQGWPPLPVALSLPFALSLPQ